MMSLHHRLLIAGTIMRPVLRNHLQSLVTTVILPLQLQEEVGLKDAQVVNACTGI